MTVQLKMLLKAFANVDRLLVINVINYFEAQNVDSMYILIMGAYKLINM